MATRTNTVSQFKEVLKPSLTKRPIYVRKDEDEYPGGDANVVATKIANDLPLVRVRDFVIHKNEIEYFSLEIANSFFPRITITFNDEYYRCRRTLSSKLEFITLFFGNTVDEYYIKQEYVLGDIYADPISTNITLSGYLYIPNIYKQHIRYFNDDNDCATTWKIVKKLCSELGLGFFTNIDDTNDAQTWIQNNCTTLEFMENTIFKHAYISNDTEIVFFIDQHDYLNMIDVKRAYANKELETTAKHPYSGSELDTIHDVILSSRKYTETNYPFMINSWTANFRYGTRIDSLPSTILRNEYAIDRLPFEIKSNTLETNTHVVKSNFYYEPIFTDNVHSNYRNILNEHVYVNSMYDQGDEILLKMEWPIMLLYPYQYIELELYTQRVRVEFDKQDEQNIDELDKIKPNDNGMVELKDELHSGSYIITSIHYDANKIDENNVQYITARRLPLSNVPNITTQ